MMPIIQCNAERLRELHAKIGETVKNRSKSAEDFKIWEDACHQFHSEYDSLAFPGGLTRGMEKIKEGDLQTIDIALSYLEGTPYCFRSQYVATRLKRALNKVPLPEPFASRFMEWKRLKRAQAGLSWKLRQRPVTDGQSENK